MTPEDIEKLAEDAANLLNELLSRPPECSALGMELLSAVKLGDVAGCREVLRDKGRWLVDLKGYELAEIMDSAIFTDAVAETLVVALLEAGVPAQTVYDRIGAEYQHTPLVTAARRGRLDLVQRLAAAGADPFWTSPTGANALSEILPSRASQALIRDTPERTQVREWLVQQGVRIDPLCADSRRKLLWASSNPVSWPDVPALLDIGIPLDATGWTPFMLQVATGRADSLAAANVTADELQHRDAWQRTPFLLAVAAGDLELVRTLAGCGSDVQAKGHCEASALHLAAKYNHRTLMEWLLQNGLPLDIRDKFGGSALYAAVDANCVEAASFLLKKGADVQERDRIGYGLMHKVSFTGDCVMLKLLLIAGSDVNEVSGGGTWPLRDACEAGNAEAVSFLLQAGAKPDLTSSGETALFAAVSGNSLECVRLLLQAGADANAQDCDGWTCLFLLRSEPMAHLLLEHGASPQIADQCGGLPEDWGWVPMPVRRLLKHWRISGGKSKQ